MARKKITEKQFELKREELRKFIRESVSPFPPDFSESKAERLARSALDKGYFFRTYLPHYFHQAGARFHDEMHALADELLAAIAAPRGHAKSTHMSFGEPLYDLCHAKEKYIQICSDVKDLAEDLTAAIKLELEENPRLRHDFGGLVGRIEWHDDVFVAKNDVKVEALGSGQKPRGRKHKQWRVTKFIGDDLENDENVENPAQRDKLNKWLMRAIRPTLEPDFKRPEYELPADTDAYIGRVFGSAPFTDGRLRSRGDKLYRVWERGAKMFVVGTILHYDSLLARLVDEKKNKRWKKRLFEACDEEFRNVLWPARWPEAKLREECGIMGEAEFAQEYRNRPVDPAAVRFRENKFQFFTASEFDFVSLPHYGFLDPSLGKERSDTQGISVAAVDPEGVVLVRLGLALKEPPLKLLERILALQREYNFVAFGIEAVAFQEVLKAILDQESQKAKLYLPVIPVPATVKKELRIERLPPAVEAGQVKFAEHLKDTDYMRQFYHWPKGKHDDAPDSLEGLLQIVKKGGKRQVKTTPRGERPFGAAERMRMRNYI